MRSLRAQSPAGFAAGSTTLGSIRGGQLNSGGAAVTFSERWAHGCGSSASGFGTRESIMRLDIYRREDRLWAWRLFAANGNIIATDGGQGYEDRGECAGMARAILGGSYAAALD